MKGKKKVEFIESYIKIGNSDYQWNDNHGELIRCKDCRHYMPDKRYECFLHDEHTEPENYCSWAKKIK